MKPRQRKPQKQWARLYARKNDHRDILYYDTQKQKYIYHGALYWTEENEDKVIKEHVVWAKYPKKGLVYACGGDSSHGGGLGWMDAERQFNFGVPYGGGARGTPWLWEFPDAEHPFVVCATYYSYWEFAISEDGVIWQRLNYSAPIQNTSVTVNIGKDGLMGMIPADYWRTGDQHLYCYIIRFSKDEETGKWSASHKYFAFSLDDFVWSSTVVYMGVADDGAFITKEVENQNDTRQWFRYHMDMEGNLTMLSDPVPPITKLFARTGHTAWCRVGHRNFFVIFNRSRRWTNNDPYYDTYQNSVIAMMSMDGGRTWNSNTLFSYVNNFWNAGVVGLVDDGYISYSRLQMFERDGEVFILTGQTGYSAEDGSHQYDVRMFSTLTGTAWNEVALPKWLDLNMLTAQSGPNVSPSGSETLRIHVHDIDESQLYNYGYNCLMYHLGNTINQGTRFMNRQNYNIMFKDGKLSDHLNEDFYMCIGDRGLHMFFDNKYMAENAQSFAWYERAYVYEDQIPDTVIPYDYCAPGSVATTETEESNE